MMKYMKYKNGVKIVRIRSFSGLHFSGFGLNAERYLSIFSRNSERYLVSLRTQSESREIQTRKIPNTDTFYAVKNSQEFQITLS